MIDFVQNDLILSGRFTASITVGCSPRTLANLRPLVTLEGDVEEWQMLTSDPPQIDWKAASDGTKPTPGSPIVTPSAIRFHPLDVNVSREVEQAISEMRQTRSDYASVAS